MVRIVHAWTRRWDKVKHQIRQTVIDDAVWRDRKKVKEGWMESVLYYVQAWPREYIKNTQLTQQTFIWSKNSNSSQNLTRLRIAGFEIMLSYQLAYVSQSTCFSDSVLQLGELEARGTMADT